MCNSVHIYVYALDSERWTYCIPLSNKDLDWCRNISSYMYCRCKFSQQHYQCAQYITFFFTAVIICNIQYSWRHHHLSFTSVYCTTEPASFIYMHDLNKQNHPEKCFIFIEGEFWFTMRNYQKRLTCQWPYKYIFSHYFVQVWQSLSWMKSLWLPELSPLLLPPSSR